MSSGQLTQGLFAPTILKCRGCKINVFRDVLSVRHFLELRPIPLNAR
jgi:hypothetical protein